MFITWYEFSIEGLNNGVTLLFSLHAYKSNTTTNSIWVTKHSGRNNLTKIGEHFLQIIFCHVD